MTFRSGEILEDRYKINALLGQVGFGAVYKAQDLRLNILCAIKESFDVSEEATRQFRREASMLAELRHPNLPRVTDYFDLRAKGLYLVMDFIEGEDLGTKLNKNGGRFTQKQVTPWLRQICDALDYLHSHNPPIIHRDIKLQNIIVTKEDIAILVDFGLAKFYDPSRPTTMGAQGGTPGFSPIEQYGQGSTDQRSDIYSLGATIYALLTGQVPPESIQRVMTKDSLKSIRMTNPTVTIPLSSAVIKALEIIPDRRIQTVKEFMDSLSGFNESRNREKENSLVKEGIASIKPIPKEKKLTLDIPQPGEIRSGVIASISPTMILVSVGANSEGVICGRELEQIPAAEREAMQVGAEIPVYVLASEDYNGNIVISYTRAMEQKGWEEVERILESDEVYASKIEGYNKGGLIVPVHGLRGFVPASEIGMLRRKAVKGETPKQRWDKMVGDAINVRVIEVDRNRRRLILSERAANKDEKAFRSSQASDWNSKGYHFVEQKQYKKALHCYEKALELDSQISLTWCNKGWMLDELGRYEEAIHCYDKALEIDPQNGKVWINKGWSLGELGRHEEAIYCYDKALEIVTQDNSAWYNKGWSLGQLGRHEEAIRCYDKALELDPKNGLAWTAKGWSLNVLARHEEAIQEAIHCLDKALELDPKNSWAWKIKGMSLEKLGRPEEAIRCLDKALKLDPQDGEAWNNKGRIPGWLGNHEEDVNQCYDKALDLDAQNYEAWYSKGMTLFHLSRFEEAILCYEIVLELDPQNYFAWVHKGLSLRNLGRDEEAIICFDKALNLDPQNSLAWVNKGLSLSKLGHFEESERCNKKASELGLSLKYDYRLTWDYGRL